MTQPHQVLFARQLAESSATAPEEGETEAVSPPALRWVLVLLLVGAVLALWPLWVPLLLASWGTFLARPMHDRLARHIGGHGRAAGVVTVLLVLLLLFPLLTAGFAIASTVADLVVELRRASGAREALNAFLAANGNGGGTPDSPRDWFELLQRHATGAMSAAETVFGVITAFGISFVVFVFGFYTFLVHGRAGYAWFLEHTPLPQRYVRRLVAAFEETGRGLLIGIGFTALLQGGVAGIAYALIGVPQALLLGLLTAFSSLLPVVGTGLIWGPVAIALLIAGQPGASVAVLVMGALVASLDNLVRPLLTHHGRLELPTFVVFIAMLGGLMTFGVAGILLGPLFIRLLVEGLRINREGVIDLGIRDSNG